MRNQKAMTGGALSALALLALLAVSGSATTAAANPTTTSRSARLSAAEVRSLSRHSSWFHKDLSRRPAAAPPKCEECHNDHTQPPL